MDQLNDEELVKLATEAEEWANEAEWEAGSSSRWIMADSYLELSERGWTQQKIANECKINQSTVSRYVTCAKNYAPGHNRPTFAFSYREVKGEKLDSLHSSESDEWETPQELFDLLHGEFGFDLDVCATEDNAKCGRFFTEAENGLERRWEGVCWMNPPYSQIDKWMAKASDVANDGATVVCLVPARTDTAWWWDNARQGEVRFIRGRLKFGGGKSSAPFPSAVVVLGAEQTVKWWEEWPGK